MSYKTFDEYLRKAQVEERERIIALLESDCTEGIGDNLDGCFHEVAIALIKGEDNA
jgi:hypothetical protein